MCVDSVCVHIVVVVAVMFEWFMGIKCGGVLHSALVTSTGVYCTCCVLSSVCCQLSWCSCCVSTYPPD